MKKLISLAFLFSVLCPGLTVQAHATDFNYTGNTADNIDGSWTPGDGGSIAIGPGGDDGIAQQFTIEQQTLLTQLDITGAADPVAPGTTSVTYNLYTGSKNTFLGNPSPPLPDPGTLAFKSTPSAFTATDLQQVGVISKFNDQVTFNQDLQPGTYWLSEEGMGPVAVDFNSITYAGNLVSNVAQTPEPPILVFFLVLAGFVVLKRREYREA